MRNYRRFAVSPLLALLLLPLAACSIFGGDEGSAAALASQCAKLDTDVRAFIENDLKRLNLSTDTDPQRAEDSLWTMSIKNKSEEATMAGNLLDSLKKKRKAAYDCWNQQRAQQALEASGDVAANPTTVPSTTTTAVPPAALDKVEAITFTPEAKQVLTNTLGLTSTGDPKRFAFGDPSRPDEVTINKVNWDLFVTDRDPSLSFSREPLKSEPSVKAFHAETGERAVAARKALQAAIDADKAVQAAAVKEKSAAKTVDDCRFIPVQFLKQVDYDGLAYFFTDANGVGKLQVDPGYRRAPAGDVAWLCAISTNASDPNAPYNIVENGGARAACGNPLSKPASPATARPETDTKPVTGPTTTVATTAPERGVSATSTSASTSTTARPTTTTAHVTTTTRATTTTTRATTTTAAPTTTRPPTTSTTRGCPPGQVPNTSVPGQCLETKPGSGISGNGSANGNTMPGTGTNGQTPDTIRQTGSEAETPTITTARVTTTAAPTTTRATTTTRAATTVPPTTPATTGTTSGPTTTIQAANQPSVVTAGTTPLCDRAHPNGVTCD